MAESLDIVRAALLEEGPLPLAGTEVTEAILLRLGAYYSTQSRIKTLLGKRVGTAGADFFVEALLFYLGVLATSHDLEIEVASERAIARRRGAMRPDLTIWRGSKCLAFIECKTQLGWKRGTWSADFESRELRIVEEHVGARGFLVVMTEANWSGFGTDPRVGEKLFVLSRPWPGSLDPETVRAGILNPIEGLLRTVVTLASSRAD